MAMKPQATTFGACIAEARKNLKMSQKELAEKIIGAGEMWLTELSTAELRDLLTLRGDAVSEDG